MKNETVELFTDHTACLLALAWHAEEAAAEDAEAEEAAHVALREKHNVTCATTAVPMTPQICK